MTAPQPVAARVAALRERRAAEGLTRLELWARPEHHARIKAYAELVAKEKK
jgi:hypothetical protein